MNHVKETLLENLHKLANKATEERRTLKTGGDGYEYLCGYEYGIACAISLVSQSSNIYFDLANKS